MPRRSQRAAATVAASRIKKMIDEQDKSSRTKMMIKEPKIPNQGVKHNIRAWKKLNRHKSKKDLTIRRPRKLKRKGLTPVDPRRFKRKSFDKRRPTQVAEERCGDGVMKGNRQNSTASTQDYFWRDERKRFTKRRPARVINLGCDIAGRKGDETVAT